METAQHLGVVRQALLRLLDGRPLPERLAARLLDRLGTWPADDFARFTHSPRVGVLAVPGRAAALPPGLVPLRAPEPESIAPAGFERRFARLQRERRYAEMWDLVAEDARRAWGGRRRFVQGMRDQESAWEVVDVQVGEVTILPEWTDDRHRRAYRSVASLAVVYHARRDGQEVRLERQVHLVPAAGGWRALCYPPEAPVGARA